MVRVPVKMEDGERVPASQSVSTGWPSSTQAPCCDPRHEARHHPRPADHVLIEDGQQTDREICFVDLTLQRAPVVGLLMSTKPLAPARCGVLLPGSEDPPKLWPPLSGRRHHTHRGHPFGSSPATRACLSCSPISALNSGSAWIGTKSASSRASTRNFSDMSMARRR